MPKRNVGRAGDGVRLTGTRNGRKYWHARLYWIDERTGKAREKRVTIEAPSKYQAMARRAELLEAARAGTATRSERLRWQTVSDAWFATVTVRATRHSWGSHRRALDRVFGEHWIDAVTARELQDHLDAMQGSPGYVNSRRDVASHILDHAIRLHAATRNVAKDVRKRSTRVDADALEDAPQKALTAEDARRVIADLAANEPDIYPLALTQLELGCRFAEVSALRWEDVDLDSGIVRIRRGQWGGTVGKTKGRYARLAALSLDTRAMLRAHRDRMAVEQWPSWDVLVFPRPPFSQRRRHSDHWSITTVGYKLVRSYKRCGLTLAGRTHIWRHTMVTLARELANAQVLRSVVGHTTEQVHERYQHAHSADVISLAEALGQKLGGAKPQKEKR